MTSEQPRTRGITFGHLFGARLVIQPSTILMLLLLAVLFSTNGGGELNRRTFSLGLLFAIVLFVSVFLHELAHAATARAFGRRVNEVVITLWGGHTTYDARGLTPTVSGVTSASGPVANLAIAAVAALPMWAGWVDVSLVDRITGEVWLFATLQWIVWSNVVLAAFNALPGIPMDGGRVLEAVVWAVTGSRHRGMRVAAWGGRVVAVGFVLWVIGVPLLRGSAPAVFDFAWAGLIFIILWPAASQALKAADAFAARERFDVTRVMVPAIALPHTASVAHAREVVSHHDAGEVIVLTPDHHAAGHFPVAMLDAVPEEDRESTTLMSVTMPLPRGAQIDAADGTDGAIAAVQQWWGTADALVVIREGVYAGVLRLQDVLKSLE
ncbi:site-2 protease family protein [Demequina globuliformis]|uniref:site-2 protease family protein n=1 Tax=Demequina globuliformis TaxID=676202 RepID=UPI000A6000B2|nr:site-2 protease family protein [Demequina globuliformis]